MIVIAIIAIIAAIALPNLKDARKAANEAAAIAMLRSVHSAQNVYREQDKDGNGTLDYAHNTVQLVNVGLLSAQTLSAPRVVSPGYSVGASTSPVLTPTQFTWCMLALPDEPGDSGDRYFFITQRGVLRYCISNHFGAGWPTIWPAIGK